MAKNRGSFPGVVRIRQRDGEPQVYLPNDGKPKEFKLHPPTQASEEDLADLTLEELNRVGGPHREAPEALAESEKRRRFIESLVRARQIRKMRPWEKNPDPDTWSKGPQGLSGPAVQISPEDYEKGLDGR